MTRLQIKGRLKQKYAELTDDDLKFAEGKEEELLGRLQQRLGKSPEEIHKEIELIERYRNHPRAATKVMLPPG